MNSKSVTSSLSCWIYRTLTLTIALASFGNLEKSSQGADYEVGPGKALEAVEDVPWEALEPGDLVLIHGRTEPYRAKWVICRRGTADQPIVVRGVQGPDGHWPVIEGRDAVTRPELNFWSEGRGLIKVGGANRPADTMPAHIIIENLEIRSARPSFHFLGREGKTEYLKNAAAIFIEKGEHITIRNCVLRDCGNGLFASSGAQNVLVERCSIFNNGIEGSIYEHNNYTSAQKITFQFNHFGPLREGCPGNNLKDRSAGMVVRYNWIEGGNRCLDLVDGSHSSDDVNSPDYHETFVYGNILVKLDDKRNNQVVHYGGDSDNTDRYRKGVLRFYNNTVVSYRPGNTALFRLSTNDERVDCRNNIFESVASGRHLALLTGTGTAELHNNFFKEGWRASHSTLEGEILERGARIVGASAGLVSLQRQDYRLAPNSPCIGAGGPLEESASAEHPLQFQYVPHRFGEPRPQASPLDLGAFAFGPDRR